MADANLIFSFSHKLPQMHHQFFFEWCQPESMEKIIILKINFPFKISHLKTIDFELVKINKNTGKSW